MNAFDLLRPATLGDALLAIGGAKAPTVKAGGIDLLDRMKEGIHRPAQLLDIRPLAELRGIEKTTLGAEGGPVIRIGALATLAEVAASPLVREHARALAEAAQEAATPQVRNRATVGGNLHQHVRCWYYRNAEFEPCLMHGGKECYAKDGRNKIHAIFGTDTPCVAVDPSNIAPALWALGASVEHHMQWVEPRAEVASKKTSRQSIENVLVPGRNSVGVSEPKEPGLLTQVYVPLDAKRRSAYREFGERESFDWALASCAVAFDWADGVCSDPAIVLGSVALNPHHCRAAETLLAGKKLTPELAREVATKALEGAKPLAENGYKVPVARALVARALLAAVGMEEKK